MKNILRKSLMLTLGCLIAGSIFAETTYILSGKCNVPLTKELKNSKYQILKCDDDGTNLSATTDISCDVNNASGFYYNSTSAAYSDLKNISNYSTSSSSNHTMQALKLSAEGKMTITLNSITISKILVVYSCSSSDNTTMTIANETVTTKDKNVYSKEIEGTFTSKIEISSAAKEYKLFIILVEGQSAPPVSVTGVSLDKTSLELEVGDEVTLNATVKPDNATNKAVEWKSDKTSVATVDQNGKVNAVAVGDAKITVTTKDGNKTATCNVKVKAATTDRPLQSISIPATLQLTEGGSSQLTVTYTPSNTTTDKTINWKSSNTGVATVSINGTVNAIKAGTSTITAEVNADKTKTAQCIVTVKEASPVPQTNLTLHTPGVYEDEDGYDTPLAVFSNSEYEVYYAGRTSDSKMSILTKPADKTLGIEDAKTATATYCKIADGWGEFTTASVSNSSLPSAKEEFKAPSDVFKTDGKTLKIHIKGFDQFSYYAQDKNVEMKDGDFKKKQRFQVFIDGQMQPETQCSTSATIRRYDITTAEHVIEVKALENGQSLFYGFSLRVGERLPMLKHLSGNDTTQSVLCTRSIQDIVYRVKYNETTTLEWVGAQATGIKLEKRGSTGVVDTMVVTGTPVCPAGEYTYKVVAKQNGEEISSLTGKITVTSKIEATTDTIVNAYTNEAIDPIIFRCYAAESEITVSATTPAWITKTYKDNTYTISGTPTQKGTHEFTVGVKGGNSIKCKITVEDLVLGDNPIMYLYKNSSSGVEVFKTLNYTPVARKTQNSLRPTEQFSPYKLIIISEDVDADNEEVLDIIDNVKKPVLNMKSFTYTRSRLDYGYPDNGSVHDTAITVLQPSHPVFKGMNVTTKGEIRILKTVNGRGLMPVEIDNCDGSYALATAKKQGVDYDASGDDETFLHEIPASKRGAKYILFPLSRQSADQLNTNGMTLLKNIIEYLLGNEQPTVTNPELAIKSFSVNGIEAKIDGQEISVELPAGTNLKDLRPQITLADPVLTKVTPASGDSVAFPNSPMFGVDYVVTDFIHRKVYTAHVTAPTSLGDMLIEGVWFDGEMLHNTQGEPLNIYNLAGTLITFTDSDFSFTGMPHSLYLVVGTTGNMKILY